MRTKLQASGGTSRCGPGVRPSLPKRVFCRGTRPRKLSISTSSQALWFLPRRPTREKEHAPATNLHEVSGLCPLGVGTHWRGELGRWGIMLAVTGEPTTSLATWEQVPSAKACSSVVKWGWAQPSRGRQDLQRPERTCRSQTAHTALLCHRCYIVTYR